MNFIITGTSQHFSRLIINVDQNNIGLFHKGRYINIPLKQQNEKLVFCYLGIWQTWIFRERRLVLS